MIDEDAIRQRWKAVGCQLDERGRRLFAAGEVRTAGWGGLAVVSKITGLARSTINRGEDDIDAEPLPKGRVRCAGGGRRAVCENDQGLGTLGRHHIRRPAGERIEPLSSHKAQTDFPSFPPAALPLVHPQSASASRAWPRDARRGGSAGFLPCRLAMH